MSRREAGNRFATAAPTIRDVAARAGVATATVSNVLTGRRAVAPDKQRLVLEAVAALGYRPNHIAASLRRRDTRTVGIVVPDITNPFFTGLVRRIEERAADAGYESVLVDCNESTAREGARLSALLARMIDGLIVAPTEDNLGAHAALLPRMPPAVLIDRGFGMAGFDTVALDNADATLRGCRHLLELGHRDIALLVSARERANIRDRIAGYRSALNEAGCGGRARVIVGGVDVESCRAAIEQELRRADRPTAVFAATYPATLGAVKAIRALDLAFPDDVSLLGFDDSDWMTVLRPYVSTIVQPVAALADRAWQCIGARLERSAAPFAHLRLPCTVAVRESTRPPPAEAAPRRRRRRLVFRLNEGRIIA
ncbi:MAG: LacI family DNA-binding transcriptional regulator [Rhodospirillales bacterium]|nr:LacI family DNA-binding transcriptional regulator [Rhodospirillales bacterium]